MAKGKYKYWMTEDGQTLLKDWARNGATDEQIAEQMHISRSTFYEWKKKYPDISDALKESKDICDGKVENALYQAALSGNTTAMIFWLKNRRRSKWRDNPEDEANAAVLSKAEELLGGVDSAID